MPEIKKTRSTGGIAPFGYLWQDGELVVSEKEAPVRRLIYELFLKYRRKKTVAKLLNDLGYRTRNDALFSDTTIDRLLRDTTAKGIRTTNNEAISIEPIISPEIWQRANNLLGTRPGKQAVQLFIGIVFCQCGGKMIVPSNLAKYVCSDCRHKIGTADLEEIFVSRLGKFTGFSKTDGEAEQVDLSDIWQHLTQKEKRIIAEQTLDRIVVGKTEIRIEYAYAPDSFKTTAFGQQNGSGNEIQEAKLKESAQGQNLLLISEPLLGEAAAAKFLGISKMTLLRRRNAGEIGFFRVGFRVLYSKEKHLLPFLDAREKLVAKD